MTRKCPEQGSTVPRSLVKNGQLTISKDVYIFYFTRAPLPLVGGQPTSALFSKFSLMAAKAISSLARSLTFVNGFTAKRKEKKVLLRFPLKDNERTRKCDAMCTLPIAPDVTIRKVRPK